MNTYREQQLQYAQSKLNAARAALAAAKTNIARRDANEEIEFWSNKTAFFTNVAHGQFPDEK